MTREEACEQPEMPWKRNKMMMEQDCEKDDFSLSRQDSRSVTKKEEDLTIQLKAKRYAV